MTIRWGVLGLVAAVVLLATSVTACGPTAPTLLFGIHDDVTYNSDNTMTTAILDAEQGIHASVVRETLRWNVVEATKGVFDWSKPDFVVDQALARNMQVYFIVRDAPKWASGSSDPKVVPSDATAFTTFVTRYKTFLKAAVQRYGSKVNYWEIWSEPNEDHYWQPLGLRPNRDKKRWIDLYAQLYKTSVAYVKDISSTAKFTPGALTGLTQSCCILGTDYLQELIDRKVPFSYLAINPHTTYNEAPWVCTPGRRNLCDIQAMRNVLVKNNLSKVQLWVTEFGWQVGGYTKTGTSTTVLRVPGDAYRLALWPNSGQVVVAGQTYDYSSIDRTSSGYSDIHLAAPMALVPPNGTQISSPQAEATQASYVKAAYRMMKGDYQPATGRPNQNYSYVKMALYFYSYDKTQVYWGMYGLFRTPVKDPGDGHWTLASKPAAAAFAKEATTQ
jgi:hypothetical protein